MKQDRTVTITGAAGGMGALLVARFLVNGDTVIATDTSEDALNKLPTGSTRAPDSTPWRRTFPTRRVARSLQPSPATRLAASTC
jgi:nucleoside-diphosphate-sugar epimerase